MTEPAAMTMAESLDAYYRIDGLRWQMWICADCDPQHNSGDEGDSPYPERCFVIALVGQRPPDHCPQCGGYLGFTEGAGPLRLTHAGAK